MVLVQPVRVETECVHFSKKLPFSSQMISNMYSFDPDRAQSILTRLTHLHLINIKLVSIISKIAEKSEKNNISRIGR